MKSLSLILLASLFACSPAQRDWRNNTSIDLGVGGDTTELNDSFTYVGTSYYISHGFSASIGMWNNFYGNVGSYWGANWSFVPFGD